MNFTKVTAAQCEQAGQRSFDRWLQNYEVICTEFEGIRLIDGLLEETWEQIPLPRERIKQVVKYDYCWDADTAAYWREKLGERLSRMCSKEKPEFLLPVILWENEEVLKEEYGWVDEAAVFDEDAFFTFTLFFPDYAQTMLAVFLDLGDTLLFLGETEVNYEGEADFDLDVALLAITDKSIPQSMIVLHMYAR